MTGITQITVLLPANEAGGGVLAGSGRPNDMEVQDAVEDHAQTHCTTLEPILQSIFRNFEDIPLLRLARVLRGVCPGVISATLWVERHHVDTAGTEHRKVEVVGYDELVIFGKTSLQGHALRVLAVALMRLVRPGEEESALSPVFQAIQRSAVM